MIRRRPVLASLAAMVLPVRRSKAAEALYVLDPRFGSIEFAVSHMGLFTSRGQFRRFDARLVIDPGRPERTRITASTEVDSLDMPWPQAVAILRSPDFFDAARFPHIRFRSSAATVLTPTRFLVPGLLAMRGVERPLTLQAALLSREAADGVADFELKGTLRRSAFGMSAEHLFISDQVALAIRARIRLAG